MKHDSIKVAQDPTLPVGRCVIVRMADCAILYRGHIGGFTEEELDQAGVVLVLNPIDYADCNEFVKGVLN